MALSEKQYNIIFLAVTSVILFIIIFKWIDFLAINNYFTYVIENFTSGPVSEKSSGTTSHTVNLPLTTSYSCKNFCGPTSRCAITGQQCFTDIDCPGCQPNLKKGKSRGLGLSQSIPGDNDAGKLTFGVTPQYSSLTSGYGTQERIVTKDMYAKPAAPNFGVNTWSSTFNEEQSIFDTRYKPSGIQFMPNYPTRYSLTGQFIEDGPYPSNANI